MKHLQTLHGFCKRFRVDVVYFEQLIWASRWASSFLHRANIFRGEVFSGRGWAPGWAPVVKTSDGFDLFRIGNVRSFGARGTIRYPFY